MKKRVLSLLLALVLAVSVLVIPAGAASDSRFSDVSDQAFPCGQICHQCAIVDVPNVIPDAEKFGNGSRLLGASGGGLLRGHDVMTSATVAHTEKSDLVSCLDPFVCHSTHTKFVVVLMSAYGKYFHFKSFLYYVPYGVLSAMTFPYIFYSTGNTITATCGTVLAFLLAIINRPLIEVAAFSSLIAFLTSLIF